MRELVRASQYVLTIHANEEMEADGLSVFDVEQCIMTGRIVERQKDRVSGEWKYVIHGKTVAESDVAVVAKPGPTDKVIVLTVFVL
jgi:hypothetical protein